MVKRKKNCMTTQIAPTPVLTGESAKKVLNQIKMKPSKETQKGKEILLKMFKDKEIFMCKYCDPEIMAELPEMHSTAQGGFSGRIFDTCIDSDRGLPYIMLPGDYDIPIKYCPFCGRKLK